MCASFWLPAAPSLVPAYVLLVSRRGQRSAKILGRVEEEAEEGGQALFLGKWPCRKKNASEMLSCVCVCVCLSSIFPMYEEQHACVLSAIAPVFIFGLTEIR